LDSAEALLSASGDIISGHPDRHVLRVRIGAIDAILKREHVVPWKDRFANWRAGFGWVSVSIREAMVLRQTAACGIAVPEWMAVGESADGRAFLLLRAIGRAQDLRRYLQEHRSVSELERRSFARLLARRVARIHELGFEYPDLYAKHVLIDSAQRRISFLDWQRGRRTTALGWRARCRDLAALSASLSDELASPADKFIFLLAYYRCVDDNTIGFKRVCRRIERRTRRLLKRSSLREQRLPTRHESQTLVWLDGEALCVTPFGQSLYDRDSLERLAYNSCDSGSGQSRVELPNGHSATLVCRVTRRRLGPVLDCLRQRHWISPEARHAADLLRLERLGEPPRLLAFGQRIRGFGLVQSFLLTLDGENA
jgi:tRNA A-37 threonylcarbamoyl transferase component Bud32